MFSRSGHTLGHKIRLNKLKSIDHTKYALWLWGSEIKNHNRRKFGKFAEMWKLNNTFVNNQWGKEKVVKGIRKYFDMDENEYITYCSLWDASKSVLSGNVRARNTYLNKRRKIWNPSVAEPFSWRHWRKKSKIQLERTEGMR